MNTLSLTEEQYMFVITCMEFVSMQCDDGEAPFDGDKIRDISLRIQRQVDGHRPQGFRPEGLPHLRVVN